MVLPNHKVGRPSLIAGLGRGFGAARPTVCKVVTATARSAAETRAVFISGELRS